MASQISRILPLLVITLFCIGAVEGGYSVVEYFLFRQPVEETVPAGTPAAREKEGQLPSGGKRDLGIILTRNLFGQHFKTEDAPAAPTVDVAANLEKSDLDVVLVGTIGGSDGTQRAIILDKKTRKQDLYQEGDEVKGASVKEILRGKVILDVQGKEELLDMSEAASVRPVVKVPQLPPPPPRQAQQTGDAGLAAQPEARAEPSASGAAEVAPTEEAAPPREGMEEPPEEMAPEVELETVPPEDVAPEAAPDVVPEVIPEASPEAAPPSEELQAPETERKIVRPRVIRPYRPS